MRIPTVTAWILTAVLFSCALGCNTSRSQSGYFVVSSRRAVEKTEAINVVPNGVGEVLHFTIKYQGKTIKAHCQAFDPSNYCTGIEVGKSYDFKREGEFLTARLNGKEVTLDVDEEKLD